MKKYMTVATLMLFFVIQGLQAENAVWDDNARSSLLGEYQGETKRIKANSQGALEVDANINYSTSISSGTFGTFTSTGSVAIADFSTTYFSLYCLGGTAAGSTNNTAGTFQLTDGMFVDAVFSSKIPNFQLNLSSLSSNTTVYYQILGVK